MRYLDLKEVTSAVYHLAIDACYDINEEILDSLKTYRKKEESTLGKIVIDKIIENDILARNEKMPICQDTGLTVVFLEIGNNVHFKGDIYQAVNEGVRNAYIDGYLRKSVVIHPFHRINTMDNTPAIIHTKIVMGDHLKITVAPKGGGSENVSLVKMLIPADGIEGVKKLVLDTIFEAGGKPCPPIIVGLGIGGNLEKAALLAKEALMRDLNDQNSDEMVAKLEKELLEEINRLGIGPMGFGGRTTALAVKINTYPCHIASLPVAINIQCHAARHKSIIL
ncbi:MAG TPA: fumarate hydratase [Bacilli bacterium]|jgi:fumarate hydratase subunit alpha|nr:fumarate hydratase [Acholeplasmataceae bacterium]HNZ77623.1 fumarate hydratase [Bacilli bacterium]HOD60490.1 fumarate hydratase [Bacilli bacterium]HOH62228.1 fumarate hydratase [Bacilli bacterium]HPM14609.1 fumarate hydratase [Bacilli bacterium]